MSDDILLRSTKGSALTHEELDGNFVALISRMTAVEGLVQSSGVVIQSTTPAVEDRGRIWIRTSSGLPLGAPYVWASSLSKWISLHPTPFSSSERRLWVGNTTDLQTYDGGEVGTATDAAGPMWEVDAGLAARFPIGVGTLPSAVVIAVTGTGGSEKVTLTNDTIPSHTHGTTPSALEGTGSGDVANGIYVGGTGPNVGTFTVSPTGGGQAHDNMPPYFGVYFIKRTARKFYAV